jgi:hypothetical protein
MAGNAGKGRPKGAKNKRTVELIKKAAASSYMDPIDLLLSVVSDDAADIELRVRAAGLAAPYLRAKLSPVEPKKPEAQQEQEIIGALLPDFVRVDR